MLANSLHSTLYALQSTAHTCREPSRAEKSREFVKSKVFTSSYNRKWRETGNRTLTQDMVMVYALEIGANDENTTENAKPMKRMHLICSVQSKTILYCNTACRVQEQVFPFLQIQNRDNGIRLIRYERLPNAY